MHPRVCIFFIKICEVRLIASTSISNHCVEHDNAPTLGGCGYRMDTVREYFLAARANSSCIQFEMAESEKHEDEIAINNANLNSHAKQHPSIRVPATKGDMSGTLN